jgi:hypothetical protein
MYDEGVEGWRCVTLEIPMPYFLVSYALAEGTLWHEKAMILWRDEDIIGFCRSVISGGRLKILQVEVITLVDGIVPRKWGTLPVVEIWSGRLNGKSGAAAICLDCRGQRMKTNAFTFEAEVEEWGECVFATTVPTSNHQRAT